MHLIRCDPSNLSEMPANLILLVNDSPGHQLVSSSDDDTLIMVSNKQMCIIPDFPCLYLPV